MILYFLSLYFFLPAFVFSPLATICLPFFVVSLTFNLRFKSHSFLYFLLLPRFLSRFFKKALRSLSFFKCLLSKIYTFYIFSLGYFFFNRGFLKEKNFFLFLSAFEKEAALSFSTIFHLSLLCQRELLRITF